MSQASAIPSAKGSQKRFVFITVFASLAFSLFVAEWVLSYQRQSIASSERMDPGMILYDARLGWKLQPDWSGQHKHYDYTAHYHINKSGFRRQDVPPGNIRYSLVGDSFSFGLGVDDNETFAALLNARGESVYNLSVPGYSTDQQLLLLKQQSDKIGRHVLLVVYLGNDLFDNMRAYPLQADHGKPYFKPSAGALVLMNSPVAQQTKPAAARENTLSSVVLGKTGLSDGVFSWLAQREISRRLGLFQPDFLLTKKIMQQRLSEPVELFLMLLDKIDALVSASHGQLTVVLLPGRSYVEQPASLSAQYQEYFCDTITAALDDSASIGLINLAGYLRSLFNTGVNKLYYPNEGHLTVLGHQYVADYLSQQINRDRTDQ